MIDNNYRILVLLTIHEQSSTSCSIDQYIAENNSVHMVYNSIHRLKLTVNPPRLVDRGK